MYKKTQTDSDNMQTGKEASSITFSDECKLNQSQNKNN